VGEVHLSFARHRPETYRLFRDLETTPSRPMLQACLHILRPSTSKFSMAVLAISFFRCDSNGMREKTGPVAIGKVFSARGLAKVLRSTPGLQRAR